MSAIRFRFHRFFLLSFAASIGGTTAWAAPGPICDAIADLSQRSACARRTLDQLRLIGVASAELRTNFATLDREIHVLRGLLEGPTTNHYKLDRIQRARNTAGKGRQMVVRMLAYCPPHQEPGLKQLLTEMQALDDSIVFLERVVEGNASFDRPSIRAAARIGHVESVSQRFDKGGWNGRR